MTTNTSTTNNVPSVVPSVSSSVARSRTSYNLSPQEVMEVEQYLNAIPSFSGLTQEEEYGLFHRMHRSSLGDARAREEVISRNLRLVVQIAKEYTGRGVPVLDLIQEGSIGLMYAADRFDPARGTRFSTFAHDWIHHFCRRHVENTSSLIRIPSNVQKASSRVARAERANEQATTEDIVHAANVTPSALQRVREASTKRAVVSLDTELSKRRTQDSERVTLADTIEDPQANTEEDAMTSVLVDQMMQAMMRVLTPRERLVLDLLYGLGERNGEQVSPGEVAVRLGISRNTVRNCHERAKAKLRTAIEDGIAIDPKKTKRTVLKQRAA